MKHAFPKTPRWLFLMDFEVAATSPNNVNTLKKVIFPVPKEIQKLSERESSDSETIVHLEIPLNVINMANMIT